MLRRPTRIPRRFTRRVGSHTRAFVERKHVRRKRQLKEWRSRHWRRAQAWLQEALRFVRRFFLSFVAGLVVLFVGIALFSPVFNVREIRVRRTDARLDIETVQRALAPLFRKRLFFLTDSDVEPLVREVVPDAATIDVRKEFSSRTLDVSIVLFPLAWRLTIEQPAVGSGTVAMQNITQQDYLTEGGFYVRTRATEADKKLPQLHLTDWSVAPVPQTHILPAAFLERVQQTEEELVRQFGLHIKKRTVFLRAREIHFATTSASLWFDDRVPVSEQIARYKLFLKAVGPQGAKEYVDLRLSGKVVYK